jgi:hypothetical protein
MAHLLVGRMFGTRVAETILASVHVRAHQQAGHMDASDLIKTLPNTLRGGGRPHMALGRQRERQADMLVSWAEMPRSPGHAFYDKLQTMLMAGQRHEDGRSLRGWRMAVLTSSDKERCRFAS